MQQNLIKEVQLTSKFVKNVDLVDLKTNVDDCDILKLDNVDDCDILKLDLNKLSNVAKNNAVKKTV